MIERKIIIGLITSTEYLKRIRPVWDGLLLESSTARVIADWCIDHFDNHSKAPNKELETVFFKKAKEGLDKDIAEEIEEDILPELSDEYLDSDFDVDYWVTETLSYLKSRQLNQLSEQIENTLNNGLGSAEERLKQAEELRAAFKPINTEVDDSIDLGSPKARKAIRRAFSKAAKPVITFAKQIGQFWNHHLVPGGFIALMGIEKRGKTFWLLEFAMTAVSQYKNVAFFQAGDMNEAEQLKRIGVRLLKRSNLEMYCEEHFQPVRDCIRNQTDECDKPERECDFSPFEDTDEDSIRKLTAAALKEYYELNEDYQPCYNCKEYDTHKLGAPWIKKVKKAEPITATDVQKKVLEYFTNTNRRFKLSTHANGTLSIDNIISILDLWEREDGFVPDVILIDYLDLLVPSVKSEFRHQQNQIWRDARRLSQLKRNNVLPLVISVTQADAQAYSSNKLTMGNFSEDKRKYGHVTAMYGLNQDPYGREKEIGLMRINELVIREGDASVNNSVTALQDLWQGSPLLGSYF